MHSTYNTHIYTDTETQVSRYVGRQVHRQAGRQTGRQASKLASKPASKQVYILYFGESNLISVETYCLKLWVGGQMKIESINP